MSALAAAFRLDGGPVGAKTPRLLGEALADRGPDGIGAWSEGPVALLHFALHATPESSREVQPAEDRESGLRLVFDGRLDDREGLRRDLVQEGCPQPGDTDADLALRAFAAFGPEAAAARLIGDFAFVLWDARRRTLVAGRDPLGIRPLLYHCDGARILLATEARALLRAGVPPVPDEGVAAEILAGGPWTRGATLIRGIRRVIPGRILVAGAEGIREREYRAIDPDRVRLPGDDGGRVEAFAAALREAVRCRLRSPAPVGLGLSGGLDSAAVAGFAAGILRAPGAPGPGIRGFTVSFPGLPCDEEALARETAAAAGIPHEAVPCTEPGPDRFLEEARRSGDMPDIPPSAALDAMAGRVRAAGLRVFLDGEGGASLLQPSPYRVADLLRGGSPFEAVREARRWGAAARVLAGYGLRPLLPAALVSAARRLRGDPPPPPWVDRAFARRVALADRWREPPPRRGPAGLARGHLASFPGEAFCLQSRETLDRWGAAAGVELRHPLWDLRLFETALALPDGLRSPWPEDRIALRRSLRGILPDAVAARGGKADFTPVVLRALRAAGVLGQPRFPLLEARGWIDPAGLSGAARDLEAGLLRAEPGAPAALNGLWNSFALETWLRAVVEGGDARG